MLFNPEWKAPEPKVLHIKDLLLRAAILLRENGHCKHTPRNDLGQMCLVGALGRAQREKYEDGAYPGATSALNRHLGFPIKLHNSEMIAWNNAPERTAEEVITALEETANAL